MATVIDGRAYAAELKERVRDELARLPDGGVGIATILIGDDYAAAVYQRRIDAHAREVGIASLTVQMPADATLGQVVGKIAELDCDPELTRDPGAAPAAVAAPRVADLPGAPAAQGHRGAAPRERGPAGARLAALRALDAAAAFHMLDRYMIQSGRDPERAYDGLNLVLVGRSTNVGKPAAILGLARNATVISCHKHTHDAQRLAEHTLAADVLVVAAGVPGLITGEMVREGAIVVDIGINPVTQADGSVRLVGDVDFESVAQRAEAVSPVPAGSARSPTSGSSTTPCSPRTRWRATATRRRGSTRRVWTVRLETSGAAHHDVWRFSRYSADSTQTSATRHRRSAVSATGRLTPG